MKCRRRRYRQRLQKVAVRRLEGSPARTLTRGISRTPFRRPKLVPSRSRKLKRCPQYQFLTSQTQPSLPYQRRAGRSSLLTSSSTLRQVNRRTARAPQPRMMLVMPPLNTVWMSTPSRQNFVTHPRVLNLSKTHPAPSPSGPARLRTPPLVTAVSSLVDLLRAPLPGWFDHPRASTRKSSISAPQTRRLYYQRRLLNLRKQLLRQPRTCRHFISYPQSALCARRQIDPSLMRSLATRSRAKSQTLCRPQSEAQTEERGRRSLWSRLSPHPLPPPVVPKRNSPPTST